MYIGLMLCGVKYSNKVVVELLHAFTKLVSRGTATEFSNLTSERRTNTIAAMIIHQPSPER